MIYGIRGMAALNAARAVIKMCIRDRYNRGVKSANFAVIKHTNMPAILVETAFIDNYDDNRFLASDDGKYKCAVGIYKGICDYLGIEYKLEREDKLMSREYEELNERLEKVENPMIYDYVDVYKRQ